MSNTPPPVVLPRRLAPPPPVVRPRRIASPPEPPPEPQVDANPEKPYFDAAAARRLAEEGIAQSYANAEEHNKDVARAVIHACANELPYFTSEDIWVRCSKIDGHTIDPRRGSFLGHLLREAAQDGVISLLPGDFPSARPANHRRILRVWRSHVYRGPDALPCCRTCGQVLLDQLEGVE